MKVIVKLPGAAPVARMMPNTLHDIQLAVGGFFGAVPFATDAAILYNESGRVDRMPYNCSICGMDFFGPVLVAGVNSDGFCDVPDGAGKLIWRDSYVSM